MNNLFAELWDKIKNPNMEIGHIRQLMTNILAAKNTSENLNDDEKWIFALIQIAPITLSEIKFYWQYKTINRYDANNFNNLDIQTAESHKAAEDIINNLINKNYIIILKNKYMEK